MKATILLPAIGVALVAFAAADARATLLRYPSNCHSGCMVVTAYLDTGAGKDWSCGDNTYGGHKGTDFAPYGSFTAMDEGRDILAAAEGDVIASHDGEFDRCTTADCPGGSGYGNWVRIQHADGKTTTYGHMRKGTVAVQVGNHVTCGQKIGQIGSSGFSTGPHLHFEVRVNNVADDPFGQGGCSGPLIYWVNQGTYNGLPGQDCEATTPNNDDAQVTGQDPALDTHTQPGATIQQKWTVKNTGDTTWTKSGQYLWTWDELEKFGAQEQTLLNDGENVAPGATRDFVVQLTMPTIPGTYSGFWKMDRFGTHRFGLRGEARFVVDATAQPDASTDADSSIPDSGDLDAGKTDSNSSSDAAKKDSALAGDGSKTDALYGSDAGGALAHWSAAEEGGCSCRQAGRTNRIPAAWIVVGGIALLGIVGRKRAAKRLG